MAKLFALEEAELEGGEVELEAAPEVGEVADVQAEVAVDEGEINEVEAGVEEGMGAADQLEQVEEVVEQAAEGEGLDPVAAEAIRIAVEAICARVGANPKSVYSLYATENFQSASSRKANTKYALEGLGEFLKSLWEKIKAALSSLWEKVKAFWNKHMSSLGRTIKALESMKAKVAGLKGTPTTDQVEVPSGLKSIFPVKARLGVSEIQGFADAVSNAGKQVDGFHILDQMAAATNLATIAKAAASAKSGFKIEFGTEAAPMPGGVYQSWEFKVEVETDDGVETATLDIQEDSGKADEGHKSAQLDIVNKEKLKALIDGALRQAKEVAKYRDKADKRAKAAGQALKALDSAIDKTSDQANKDQAKSNLRTFNLVMTKGPMIEAKLLSFNLVLMKGILGYAAACVKNTRVV